MSRLAAAAAAAVAVLGAGCAAAAGSAGPPGPAGPETTVVLELRHSRFSPSVVRVQRGSTVRFVVRNDDPVDHELIVGPAEVHDRHRLGQEREHSGDVPGEVSVPSGGAAETTYRFDRRGTVLFACHLPGHLDYGMRGRVVVA